MIAVAVLITMYFMCFVTFDVWKKDIKDRFNALAFFGMLALSIVQTMLIILIERA